MVMPTSFALTEILAAQTELGFDSGILGTKGKAILLLWEIANANSSMNPSQIAELFQKQLVALEIKPAP